MTSDRVIDLLQKAYGDEMETVMNYQTNAIVLDGSVPKRSSRASSKTFRRN